MSLGVHRPTSSMGMVMHQVFIGWPPWDPLFSERLWKIGVFWSIPWWPLFFLLISWWLGSAQHWCFPRSQPRGKCGFQCNGAGGALGRVGFHRSSQRADLPISQGGRALEKEPKCEIWINFGLLWQFVSPTMETPIIIAYHLCSCRFSMFFDCWILLGWTKQVKMLIAWNRSVLVDREKAPDLQSTLNRWRFHNVSYVRTRIRDTVWYSVGQNCEPAATFSSDTQCELYPKKHPHRRGITDTGFLYTQQVRPNLWYNSSKNN